MNRRTTVLVYGLVLSTIALAQSPFKFDPRDKSLPIGTIGVVSLPTIFPVEGVIKVHSAIPARKSPNSKSSLVMMIKSPDDVLAQEIGNDAQEALVFSRIPGWYFIRTRFGQAWVSEKNIGGFKALEDLLANQIGYLTEEWDGRLWASPSISSRYLEVKVPQPGRSRPAARFSSFVWAEGQLWLKVVILKAPACGDAAVIENDTEGWVPAFSPAGFLVFWYSSRGC